MSTPVEETKQQKNPEPSNNIDKIEPVKSRSYSLILFTLLLIILGVAWFLYWYLILQHEKSTDDAYANGNKITLNSVISGSVVEYFADDTDLVIEGQLLVVLDKTSYQIKFDEELNNLAAIVLQVRELYETVKKNEAIVKSRKATFQRTEYDFQNRSKLVGSGAVSNEDFEHAKTDLEVTKNNLKQAEAELLAAKALAGNASIEKHPLIEKQKSIVRKAFYNLEHCSIYAPFTGYVAQRTVEVGDWISPQTSLMAIISTNYVWVDANFKETELKYMRVGQPAKVWLDIYGSKIIYDGHVIGISSGTGSVFSLIPPQNATGNWIKIVQRLPVRISLNPDVVKKNPIRIGLSANVTVDITNQDLPLLKAVPEIKPIAKTTVFDIHMNKIDRLMDKIVQKNIFQADEKKNEL